MPSAEFVEKSETNNIDYLLNPRSIAVIGASERTWYSRELIKNLKRYGCGRKIFPVNPKRDQVLGLKCYHNLLEIPGDIDLAIYIIGRNKVINSLPECARKKVKSIYILAAGFKEADKKGQLLQKELSTFAKRTGIRICGPNCVGFYNLHNNLVASPLPTSEDPRVMEPGSIALISQSGGLGIASTFQYAYDRGIKFSYVITVGNEADLELSDFIQYLIRDPHTRVIALIIEGLKRPHAFLHAVEEALRAGKPIIAFKIGRTQLGAKSALSHTGKLTGSREVTSAAFKQKGVIEVEDFHGLVETASILDRCRIPEGEGIAIVSGLGGLATHLADLSEELDISLPKLEGKNKQRLLETEGLLAFGNLRNPIDVRGYGLLIIKDILKPLLDSQKFHTIVIACDVCGVDDFFSSKLAKDMIEVSKKTDKPLVALWTGGRTTKSSGDPPYKILHNSRIPLFNNPRRCMNALKALNWYGSIQRDYTTTTLSPNQKRASIRNKLYEFRDIRGSLSEKQCIKLLSVYGINVPEGDVASSSEEAVEIANSIKYPVAVKVSSRDIPHLTDAKALRLNVKSDGELVQSYNEVLKNARALNPNARVDGVYIQKMVGGVEVLVGVARDEIFGAYVVFGLGGIFVEVLGDYSIRLPPITEEEALKMISEIRGFELLEGYRGMPKADIASLAHVISKVSMLATDLKEKILELDLNPLIVLPEGEGAVVVDFLIRFK